MKPASLLHIGKADHDADLRYALGMSIAEPVVYLRVAGRTVALVPETEISRARTEAEVERVASLARYLRRTERDGVKNPGLGHAAAELCRDLKVKKVTVPYLFPLGLARQLRKLGLRIKVREGNFFPERQFKSAVEVKMITAALGMAEVGMAEALQTLKRSKPGPERRLLHHGVPLTSERLRAIIETALLQAGGLPGQTQVACGPQSCDPEEPGHGPVAADAPIVISITVQSARTGYHGHLTRTVVRGTASTALRHQFITVLKAQAMALTLLREGVGARELHATVENYFRTEGYRTSRRANRPTGFPHATGHGVGLEPRECPEANRNSTSVLRAGHVVAIQPGLYYPRTGGVRLADLALVTPSGPQNLTQFEKILEL
jgi:Xaa-Pro aminopeptidase